MIENKERIFPATLSEIGKNIQVNHPHYVVDTTKNIKTVLRDANSDIDLICTKHDNYQFKSKWRYLRSSANKNTGQCTVCLVEKGASNKKIKKFVDENMRIHTRHRAKLIDNRYTRYSPIETDEKILIECLECGWNKDKVSINNFFACEPHVDRSYRCSGCLKIGKYGYSRGPEDNELKTKFLKLNYELTTKIIKGHTPKKIYSLRCKECNRANEYSRQEILSKAKKWVCQECTRVESYYAKKEEILKKGYMLLTPLSKYVGLKKEGKLVMYDFICIQGKHEIKRKLFSFSKTKECLECKLDKQNSESYSIFENEVMNRRGSVKRGQTFQKRSQSLWCECSHKHKFEISYEKLIDRGQWCPKCNQRVGERIAGIIIAHLLEVPGGFRTVRPNFLKNPKTQYNLELDGYNESMRLAFEYATEGDTFHRTKKQLEYDKLKAQLCEKEGVTLIHIPEFKNYGKKVKNIKMIISILHKMNIKIVNKSLDIDISKAYYGTESMKKLNTIIKRNNARLLTVFEGLHENITIQCKNSNHKHFRKTAMDIIHSGAWCNTCKKDMRDTDKLAKYKKEFSKLVKWLKDKNALFLDESIDNFKGESQALKFKCKQGHSNSNSLLDIRRKKLYGIRFCKECVKMKDKIEHIISQLKEHDNFQKHISQQIFLKNGYKILLENVEDTSLRTIVCNAKKPHKRVTKNYNLNNYLRHNTWNCDDCNREANQLLITQILGDKAKYIGIDNHKHYWNCGVKNHSSFEAKPRDIENKKTNACCVVCFPQNNKQISKETVLDIAASLHKEYSKCENAPMVLNPEQTFNSTQRVPYKCYHAEHLPFFASYDNMTRKKYWCPECQERSRKRLIQDMQEIVKIKSLSNEIRQLIFRRTAIQV